MNCQAFSCVLVNYIQYSHCSSITGSFKNKIITPYMILMHWLKPMHKNHVWSYDFVLERTSDGRAMRILNIIDEYTRECLAIHVERKIESPEVLYKLSELFITHGIPNYIRSDNGSEFTADSIRKWLFRLGVTTAFIEPGSPWENGYIESFNGKFRDELLNGEIFDTIFEAKVITEQWRQHYNKIRPHSSLKFRPPVPEVIIQHQYASA